MFERSDEGAKNDLTWNDFFSNNFSSEIQLMFKK